MDWLGAARAFEVLPSLYAADFARLGEQAEALVEAGVRVFHFDVGDGHFVEPITVGPIVLESLVPALAGLPAAFDAHLMVTNPAKHFAPLAAAGAGSVTFHVEAVADVAATADEARSLGLGVGLALNPETPVARALEAADCVDLVLCMCIRPGFSGQAFQPESLARIRALRDALPARVRLQVDGGIGPDTIVEARGAGADLFVCGSAIFASADLAGSYRELERRLSPNPSPAGGTR